MTSFIAPTGTQPNATRGHLLAIPAELRNQIYYLCYNSTAKEVDLLDIELDRKPDGQPPSKALLLTCRRVYEETRLMQKQAYQRFWSQTRFTISLSGRGVERAITEARVERAYIDAALSRFDRAADITHITYLRVSLRYEQYRGLVWVYKDGGWNGWASDEQEGAWMYRLHREIWYRKSPAMLRVLVEEQFERAALVGNDGWSAISLDDESPERVQRALQTADKIGLTTEELEQAIWE